MTDDAPLQLKKSRSDAEAVIVRHQNEGQQLLRAADSVVTEAHFNDWDKARKRWISLTCEGLKSVYSSVAPADEFERVAYPQVWLGGESADAMFRRDRERLDLAINTLESLRERLEYLSAPGDAPELNSTMEVPEGAEKIFVVHGHAEDVKEAVCRMLEKAGGHEIVILHEQPNEGRTLIEKFEAYAGASDHAVVLLTADDVGGAKQQNGDDPLLQARGRQNVVFELGFFVGRLGRSRAVVLYEDGVELPSDFKGVVYIALSDESWRYKLLQELRSAGLDFDLNKLPT